MEAQDSAELSFLAGKTVAVTGAAGRLGSEIVETLLAAGARVAGIVMNQEEAARLPGGVRAYQVNVTDQSSVEAGFAAIAHDVDYLSGLVHTVGAWGMTPLLETSLESWDRMMALNLTSAFLCCREAARVMPQGGSLVAIAAGQGADRGAAGQSAYSAAKAGVWRLMESVGAELAERRIRTLAVAPSTILFDPAASGLGVPVADVVTACLSAFDPDGPASGSLVRVYGSAR